MSTHQLFKRNDQDIDVVLVNSRDNSFINNATVYVTILSPTGTIPTGGGPLTASYSGLSDGLYRAAVTETFDPDPGPGYQIKIIATTAAGINGEGYRPAYVSEGVAAGS